MCSGSPAPHYCQLNSFLGAWCKILLQVYYATLLAELFTVVQFLISLKYLVYGEQTAILFLQVICLFFAILNVFAVPQKQIIQRLSTLGLQSSLQVSFVNSEVFSYTLGRYLVYKCFCSSCWCAALLY